MCEQCVCVCARDRKLSVPECNSARAFAAGQSRSLSHVGCVIWCSAMLGILGMFASESIHGEALWEVHKLVGR
jgi:hypothetical protein